MVVELLSFVVHEGERAEWLRHEEQHWSRFLERQAGFIRKEIWVAIDPHGAEEAPAVASTTVQAVIWWESMAAWKAIPTEQLDAVVAAMGPFERSAICEAFEVIREC